VNGFINKLKSKQRWQKDVFIIVDPKGNKEATN